MRLLSGKELSNKIKDEMRAEVQQMRAKNQSVSLAVIQVGEDPASSVYVKNKEKACEHVGIESKLIKLPESTTENILIDIIQELNNIDEVNGILVQLPLPSHINEHKIVQTISPGKDVDGFHENNVGKLVLGENTFSPCTANGIIKLLLCNNIDIAGKKCVVVGRSNIVGKPTATMLLQLNGTVTICHSKTKNLKEICKNADILVCAIGKPKFFNKDYIGDGAVVIDVGIHRTEDGLCGDVDFDAVKDFVSAITPVPGGVGAMTVAMLMHNCVQAARTQYKNNFN